MDIEVSVIMSEYNTDFYTLRKAIKSILKQSFKDYEFLIVNDGKSNYLEEVVNEFKDSRIKIINNKKNLGLAKSLNKAIKISNGKYIVRMDTDDMAHQNRIEKQLKFIKNNPEYAVVGTSINLLTDGGSKTAKIFEGEIDKKRLLNRIAPVHPSVIMKKEDIVGVGLYDETMRRSQDFALWAELLLAEKKIYVLPDILLDYRVNLEDYKKRKLKNRRYEIKSRLKYYYKLGASPVQYLSIVKSIIAGLLPMKFMSWYHKNITYT